MVLGAVAVIEEWRPIAGTDGLYEVSSLGNIIVNRDGERRAVADYDSEGYRILTIIVGGRRASHSVHRLVAAAFLGPCPDGMQVNHKDLNRANNHVSNLEYLTISENVRHSHRERKARGIAPGTGPYANCDKVIRVRSDTYDAICAVRDSFRGLSIIDAIDVLAAGWLKLTPAQQIECMNKS